MMSGWLRMLCGIPLRGHQGYLVLGQMLRTGVVYSEYMSITMMVENNRFPSSTLQCGEPPWRNSLMHHEVHMTKSMNSLARLRIMITFVSRTQGHVAFLKFSDLSGDVIMYNLGDMIVAVIMIFVQYLTGRELQP